MTGSPGDSTHRRVPPRIPAWLHRFADAVAEAVADESGGGPPDRQVPPGVTGRRSAVLILFGEQTHGPDLLLIERASTLSSHAGQPAFPGGASDPEDADDVATAVREAVEEVGLHPPGIEVFAQLPDLWVPPSGFVVAPVFAWWHTEAPIGPVDRGEVERVVRVPIRELVEPANRFRVRHPSGFIGPAFAVADMLVWGFTALVLDWVLDAGGWAVEWDETDVRSLSPDDIALSEAAPEAGP